MGSIEAFAWESISGLLAYPSPTVCNGSGLAVVPSMINCWANMRPQELAPPRAQFSFLGSVPGGAALGRSSGVTSSHHAAQSTASNHCCTPRSQRLRLDEHVVADPFPTAAGLQERSEGRDPLGYSVAARSKRTSLRGRPLLPKVSASSSRSQDASSLLRFAVYRSTQGRRFNVNLLTPQRDMKGLS